MNPVLFGDSQAPLFGVYTPAVGRRLRAVAVVCPPFGQEYLRSHRACRALADRLAVAGIDVMRFDYRGTGDSSGEATDVTLSACVADARSAIEEAAAMAAVRDVIIIGIRLGASIAIRAANGMSSVNRAVLWDPVFDGQAYLNELMAKVQKDSSTNGGTAFVRGFPVTEVMQQELGQLSMAALPIPTRRALVITSRTEQEHAAADHHVQGPTVDVATFAGPPVWIEHAHLGVGVLPTKVIEHIAQWCT